MENKVYIVVKRDSNQESSFEQIQKIFFDKEKAEDFALNLENEYLQKQDLIPKSYDYYSSDATDNNFSEEKVEAYFKAYNKFKTENNDYRKYEYFDNCFVKEYAVE